MAPRAVDVEHDAERATTGGCLDGLYRRDYACTRDQMVVYVARAFGLPLRARLL